MFSLRPSNKILFLTRNGRGFLAEGTPFCYSTPSITRQEQERVHRVAPLPPPPAGLGFCESVPPVLSFCGGATQTASSVWSGPRGYSLHRARNPRHVATFLACSACVARASANLPFCPESWKILCMTSRNTPVSCWWCEHNWAPRVASLLGKRHLLSAC